MLPYLDLNRILREYKEHLTNKTIRELKRGQIDPIELAAGIVFGSILENQKGKKVKRRNFPKSIRKAILEKQGYRCNLCGKKLDEKNFDHVDGNRSNNSFSNCQALCLDCHAKKSRKNLRMNQNYTK